MKLLFNWAFWIQRLESINLSYLCPVFFSLLNGILPEVNFSHLSDLSYGIFVLLQDRVSVDDMTKVGLLFKRFVVNMEQLYGKEHVGINVLFLTHLSQSVLDWGYLWSTSTFIPEWFNGELNTLCNGTQHVVCQMALNYLKKNFYEISSFKTDKKRKPTSSCYISFNRDAPLVFVL